MQENPHSLEMSGDNSSMGGVLADIDATMALLPVAEVAAAREITARAENVLLAVAYESEAEAIGAAAVTLAEAAAHLEATDTALRVTSEELRQYGAGVVSSGEVEAYGGATPDEGDSDQGERVASPQLVAAGDVVFDRLQQLAAPEKKKEYLALLEAQSDLVLCELLRRNVLFADHVLVLRHWRFHYTQGIRLLSVQQDRRGLEPEDLATAITNVFLRGCQRYVDSEATLLTYTGERTWHAMRRAFREEGYLVRVPVSIYDRLIEKVRNENADRAARGEPEMTDGEIAARFGILIAPDEEIKSNTPYSVLDVRRVVSLTYFLRSLEYTYEPRPNESYPESVGAPWKLSQVMRSGPNELGTESADMADPAERYIQQALRIEMEAALATLTEREQAILRARFGFNGEVRSRAEIAVEWSLTVERIRQIEGAALAKLAKTHQHLMAFLRTDGSIKPSAPD